MRCNVQSKTDHSTKVVLNCQRLITLLLDLFFLTVIYIELWLKCQFLVCKMCFLIYFLFPSSATFMCQHSKLKLSYLKYFLVFIHTLVYVYMLLYIGVQVESLVNSLKSSVSILEDSLLRSETSFTSGGSFLNSTVASALVRIH